jgi:hypothetical protein
MHLAGGHDGSSHSGGCIRRPSSSGRTPRLLPLQSISSERRGAVARRACREHTARVGGGVQRHASVAPTPLPRLEDGADSTYSYRPGRRPKPSPLGAGRGCSQRPAPTSAGRCAPDLLLPHDLFNATDDALSLAGGPFDLPLRLQLLVVRECSDCRLDRALGLMELARGPVLSALFHNIHYAAGHAARSVQ